MRKYRDYRNSFTAGVIDKDFLARDRSELTAEALKSGTNAFSTDASTVMRRPGSDRLFRPANAGRSFAFALSDGTLRLLIFYAGNVQIYQTDGTLDATVAGPWGANDLFTMAIDGDDDHMVVASRSFFPQKIAWDGTSWSGADFAFRTDSAGRKASPFVRFGQPGVTMSLAAYSGASVAVTFSEDVLTANHVNSYFRYMKNQIKITAVTNGQSGTAQIIDTIYPSLRLSITNSANYKAGDIVEGDVTNTRGQVVAVGAGTVDVVLTEGYSSFQAAGAELPGEQLVSPEASEEITAVASLGAPQATNIWFEELISAERGYPGTTASHRNRRCFASFPEYPSMLVASAIAADDDFDLGSATDRDAIIEFLGEDPNAEIRHLVSTENLILLTDRGAWHVPEGGNQSFTPQGIGFNAISPDAAATIPPVWTPEGVVFLDTENRALVLSITGTQRGAWSVSDVSLLGGHLISSPKQMVYSSGVGGRRERVIFVLNGDGSAAVFTYRRGGDQAGWYPWARRGSDVWESFTSFNGEVYCIATVDAKLTVEQFSFAAVIDSQFDPSSTSYPNESLQMLLNSQVVGSNTTDGSGVLGSIGTLSSVDKLGHDFTVTLEPAPMIIAQAGRQRRSIAKTWLDVIDTGTFRCNGKLLQTYAFDADMESQPTVGDYEYKAGQLGSSRDRVPLIEQRDGEGAPFHLRSMTMEVVAR